MALFGYGKEQWIWISVRLGLGWIMLWAFLDKTFGLGFSTTAERAWLAGGSPTSGYLQFAAGGIFGDFYNSLAGNTVLDVLFMLALLAIGISTLLGVGTKIAGYAGFVFMIMLWTTNIPPENNPIIDDHIIYAILFVGLMFVRAGQWLGLGKWWTGLSIVKKFPILE